MMTKIMKWTLKVVCLIIIVALSFSLLFAVGYYRPFTAGEAEHLQENLK